MDLPPVESLEPDQLLDELVTAYLKAVEAGQTPDRQQWLAQYPQLAADLAAFFADQDRWERLTAPMRAALGPPAGPDDTPPGRAAKSEADLRMGSESGGFGDYELLTEIGRGGMGIVYKARQGSLGRLIALKMLRCGSRALVGDVHRFQIEAEAAASLDHPHIVPIYEIGTLEGQPYFSMKLLSGGNLADTLVRGQESGVSKEACRRAAQSVATIARAIHHAHQRGILHRDLKPSNILLDAEGRPHVTDFGLAKRVEVDSSLTESGTLIGTPSYMAPEQATGKKGAITTATDVYGLGAVLYALLTGQPPFRGETVLDTLTQVQERDAEPPSDRNRRLDRDLGTICLKCLEKEPDRRYASAKALAEDLERWLAGKPIQARAVNRRERLWRWCRRNPRMATLTALIVLLLLLVVAGSTGSAFVIWRQMEQTETEKRRAQENLQTAYKILDEIYVDTAEKRLPQQTDLTLQDRQFLDKALTFYEQFANHNSSDSDVRQKTVEAYLRVGTIKERLGQGAQADTARRQALSVATKLVAEFPDRPDYRQCLARSYCSLGGMYGMDHVHPGRLPELEQAYAEALRILEQLVIEFPANLDYRHDLGLTYFCLGFWRLMFSRMRNRAVPDPEEVIRRALAIRDKLVKEKPTVFLYRKEQAMSLGNLGNVLAWANRRQEAEEVLQRELEVRQKLVEDFPGEPEARFYLAEAYMDLGNWRERTGKYAEAEETLRRQLSLRRQLAAELPSVLAHQHTLAYFSRCLGDLLREKGAEDDAIAAYKESVAAGKEAIRLKPESAKAHSYLARALAGTGARKEASAALEQAIKLSADDTVTIHDMAWFLATSPDPANQNPEQAVLLGKKAVALAPESGTYWSTLGTAYYRARRWEDAVAAFEKSTHLKSGGDSFDWFFLAMAHWQLGDREKARQWYERAVEWMDKNWPWDGQLRRFRTEAAALLGIAEQPPAKPSATSEQPLADKDSTP